MHQSPSTVAVVDTGPSSAAVCQFCVHPASSCQALAEARQSEAITFLETGRDSRMSSSPSVLANSRWPSFSQVRSSISFPSSFCSTIWRAHRNVPQVLWDIARRDVPVNRLVLQAYGELLGTLAESYVRANHAAILDRQRYGEILGLHADLAERKEIEAALRLADRRKDQFLATLAHESGIRSPR